MKDDATRLSSTTSEELVLIPIMARRTLAHSIFTLGLVSCFALSACNDDTAGQVEDAGTPEELTECSPIAELQDRAGIDARDCGTFSASTASDTLTAAQRCVLDAIERGEAFRTWVQKRGTDSAPAEGFASSGGADATFFQFFYDSDPFGGANLGPSLSVRSCSALVVTPAPCEIVSGGGLCLGCNETLDVERVCSPRVRPTPASP